MSDITGAATSVDRFDSTVAPANAPTAPGTPTRRTTRQSTLPNFQCEKPDINVVPISARWTVAEAAAGLVPMASSSVVEVTPYAMPRLPSTSWAPRPARASRMSVRKVGPVFLGPLGSSDPWAPWISYRFGRDERDTTLGRHHEGGPRGALRGSPRRPARLPVAVPARAARPRRGRRARRPPG